MDAKEFEQKFEDVSKKVWTWGTTHTLIVTHAGAFLLGLVFGAIYF